MRRLPVVILTTSGAEKDLLRNYDAGINTCVVKPVGVKKSSEALRTISLFWELVEPPG